jgi:hypothetical protein
MEDGMYLTNVSDGIKISIINFWYCYLKKEEQPSLGHSILLQFCLSTIVKVLRNRPKSYILEIRPRRLIRVIRCGRRSEMTIGASPGSASALSANSSYSLRLA